METTRVTGANIGFDSIESVQLRILNNTKKDENGCWIWQKCLDPTGYGAASISRDGVKRKIGAHVLSWRAFNGGSEVPAGLYVMHECDVRACCNPEHLSCGTQSENMKHAHKTPDKPASKAINRGEKNCLARLNDEKVREIRRLRSEGLSLRKIAEVVMTSAAAVQLVCNGTTWKHVK